MNHELHAARLVEEPLGHDLPLRGDAPQHPNGLADVIQKLRRARGAKPAFGAGPAHRLDGRIETPRQFGPQRRDGFREFRRARGRLPQPEGDVGRKALGVLHAHLVALHALHAPGVVAEQEDVARVRLDREILVHLAHEGLRRAFDHVVIRRVGNRAARGDGAKPRPAPRPQQSVHAVPVQIGGAPAPAGRNAFGEHFEHVLEDISFKLSIRLRAPYERPERLLSYLLLRGNLGHHLLGEDVERRHGEDDAVERAPSHRADRGGALQEFVPRHGEDDPLRNSALPVARSPHALEQGGERSRRAQMADEVDMADVNAEFQRRRGDDGRQRARFQPLLRIQPDLARQGAVVRGHAALAESLREPVGDALGQPPRVDEHDGRAVGLDVGGDAVEHLGPVLVRGDGADILIGHLYGQLHLALVTHVHDSAIGSAVLVLSFSADEQARDLADRLLRGAETDTL